jgi:hypothetical protein
VEFPNDPKEETKPEEDDLIDPDQPRDPDVLDLPPEVQLELIHRGLTLPEFLTAPGEAAEEFPDPTVEGPGKVDGSFKQCTEPPLGPRADYVKHHAFSQEFETEFEDIFKGSGESIHDYTIPLPKGVHYEVHSQGWNAEWLDFIHEGESYPTLEQTKDHAVMMIFEYNLQDYLPFVKYK